VIDVSIFEQLESCLDIRSLGIGITTAFYMSNLQAIPCLASYHIFPHLLSSEHKSTQPCLPHFLDGHENRSQEFPYGERVRWPLQWSCMWKLRYATLSELLFAAL
jgi:hypothetical protein